MIKRLGLIKNRLTIGYEFFSDSDTHFNDHAFIGLTWDLMRTIRSFFED